MKVEEKVVLRAKTAILMMKENSNLKAALTLPELLSMFTNLVIIDSSNVGSDLVDMSDHSILFLPGGKWEITYQLFS